MATSSMSLGDIRKRAVSIQMKHAGSPRTPPDDLSELARLLVALVDEVERRLPDPDEAAEVMEEIADSLRRR